MTIKQDVREFWEEHPLSAAAIPFEPGTLEFFKEHSKLRRAEAAHKTTYWAYEREEALDKRVLDVGPVCGYRGERLCSSMPWANLQKPTR